MEYKEHTVRSVEPGSIASGLGIVPGDVLLAVNGKPVRDVFDYRYLISDEFLNVLVRGADGREREYEIEKEEYEDLGLEFENGLMDEYRSCRNHCIFCFIDQMPPGLRETLYFKDDDSRLSFLQGNYVTLTNMDEEDVQRIIEYRLAPINISVHTTDPELRCRMLNNRFAGEALEKIRRFHEAGIEMNAQIVLCKGINDGKELERSIRDLAEFLPCMQSLSVVPVGLTRYRQGLYPLEPFTKEDAAEVLRVIRKWQEVCFAGHGNHFVHAGDEWYLLAGEEFPPEETYDGYVQLENGVGMMRLLKNEFEDCLRRDHPRYRFARTGALRGHASGRIRLRREDFPARTDTQREQADDCTPLRRPDRSARTGMRGGHASGRIRLRRPDCSARAGARRISIATGKLAAPMIRSLCGEFSRLHPETRVSVYAIENRFFGEQITVSGLLTGQDLARQLAGRDLGDCLLLPCNLLRSGEDVFLDDMTVCDLENALQVPVHIVKSDGQSLYRELLG